MFDFLLHAVTVTAIYALIAVSLNIQAGYAGLLNLGHIAFVGVGAYAIGIAHQMQWNPAVGWMLGLAVAAILGFFVSRLGRNLGADYWGIATLAVAEIVRTIALNEDWLTGGAQGISGISPMWSSMSSSASRWSFLATVVVTLLAAAALTSRLGAGRFGRSLRLMREEPALATSMGYDLVGLKSRATVASAMMAAVAGAFLGHYVSYVGPDFMLASETFMIWTMVMIGGLGNVAGVVVGALLVQGIYISVPFARDFLGIGSDVAGAVRLGVIGCLLLACLLWRKDGLLPETLRKL
ncbi:MAG: branched-chain amino acid ABC transporter permease [Hydrogenophaga sp.]|uniref:branched-chain amino acid ABC transporter permease n=1 Tax=Hydrogenophaga sp. TaxID=1904254 RepID=UPI0027282AF6|nr:branched-chain amino acid ABC transporter permease [Hydrogenophaga sp.]MDO9506367.1 branched-chain amino acid ABC transporter permease [Hydrogenophaga sp.]MDP3348230.1 branched-chain amino acid ABC transporter permease [Hydrogenophaga sp.]